MAGKPGPLGSSLQASQQASSVATTGSLRSLRTHLAHLALGWVQVNVDQQDPMAFCLYGYVHALFVEYRHTVPFEHAGGLL